MVTEGIQRERVPRLTLKFDGSLQSTKGHTEGTPVGFNKGKKGARSYYHLFCTVTQIEQFFDLHHRPCNVHDSKWCPTIHAQLFIGNQSTVTWCRAGITNGLGLFQLCPKGTRKQHKGMLKLHMFEHRNFDFNSKEIVTNKTESAKSVVLFYNGRGSQERIFGDAKNDATLNVVPSKRLAGNQLFTLCAMMAQMVLCHVLCQNVRPPGHLRN